MKAKIESLITKANNATSPEDALLYAQAAAHCASAVATMAHSGQHLS